MIRKNAQTALEFIILVAFILFFFIIFFVAVNGNISDKAREQRDIAVRDVAIAVRDEINLAFQSSDGYYRAFVIPDDINGLDYNILLIEDMVYINTSDNKYAMALPIHKVTGQIVKNQNTIKKEDGEIKINV